MTEKTSARLFSKISNRAFHLHLKDMDTLRNKFSHTQIDIPKMMIAKMKRKQLVHALLADEFGGDAVMDYISQCRQWDEDKNFVEGKS